MCELYLEIFILWRIFRLHGVYYSFLITEIRESSKFKVLFSKWQTNTNHRKFSILVDTFAELISSLHRLCFPIPTRKNCKFDQNEIPKFENQIQRTGVKYCLLVPFKWSVVSLQYTDKQDSSTTTVHSWILPISAFDSRNRLASSNKCSAMRFTKNWSFLFS